MTIVHYNNAHEHYKAMQCKLEYFRCSIPFSDNNIVNYAIIREWY